MHWNGQTWRFQESDFRMRTLTRERYGAGFLSSDVTVQDWGVNAAEYARIPFANVGLVKLPEEVDDERQGRRAVSGADRLQGAFVAVVQHHAGAGLRLNWQFGDDSVLAGHNLTSITSFSNYHMDDFQDGDGTSYDILTYLPVNGRPSGLTGGLYSFGTFDVKSITQEVRLTSPDSGRL